MTEKRLIVRDDDYAWVDTVADTVIEVEDAFDLVNVLHEENEKLKSKNRGLQSELQIFKEDVTHSNLQINKLADENEQLKQTNQRLTIALKEIKEKTNIYLEMTKKGEDQP